MAIIDIGISKQLQFGKGDIRVSPGLLETDEIVGAVSFFNQDPPKEIGEIEYCQSNEVKTIEETPIRMVFEKVESIDVVIWALEQTKKFMINGTMD